MKVKNINSSSIRTNKRIKESFVELLQEKKDLKNITVTELVKRADITRSAFYTHYDSIYDVAQDIQNETLDILLSNLNKIETTKDVEKCLDTIFDYLKQNQKTYKMLLSSNDPFYFTSKLSSVINKQILSSSLVNLNNPLKITFYTEGCINLLIMYFKHEINSSLDDINKLTKDLFKTIFA